MEWSEDRELGGWCGLEELGRPAVEPGVGVVVEPEPVGDSKTRRSNPLDIEGSL